MPSGPQVKLSKLPSRPPNGPAPGRAAEAFKALEARLALRVDLAAVERLALVVVADDLVGAVELGELGRRLRVLLVGIRVQLLRKLAISLLDVFLARAFRHPQHLIGVAHPCNSDESPSAGLWPNSLLLNVGRVWPLCNAAGRLASYVRFSGRIVRTVHLPWWMRQASPCSQDSAPSRM